VIQDLQDITSFKWATVTAIAPTLAIELDGDTAALALVPESLIDPLQLAVNDRVRVELSLRKCVIHGRSAGRKTETHFGVVDGISSTGVLVTLEDGLGQITATRRSPKYYPSINDRVMVERSGLNYTLSSAPKVAGSVRVDLPLTANWIRYSTEAAEWGAANAGPYRPPVAYKTTNGIVKVAGLIKKWQGGAFASGEKIATLPVGFRPEYPCMFASNGSSGGTPVGSGRLLVNTDGSIYALDAPADSSFVSLEQIIFPIGLVWTAATLQNSFTAYTAWPGVGACPAVTFPVPGYAQDSNGITWTRGGVTRASDATDNLPIFTYPNGLGPILSASPHFAVAGHTTTTRSYTSVGIGGATSRIRGIRTGASGSLRNAMLDGTPFVSESSTLVPYGATLAEPQPAIAASSNYSGFAYWAPRAYLTPEGMVHLHGLSAVATAGQTLGYVANDLRPQYKNLYAAFTTSASGRGDIYPNGKIVAASMAAGWFSLDCMHWVADLGAFDQAPS